MQRALHRGGVQLEIGLEALAGAGLKLLHLIRLASEGLHHLDRAQPFLRHGQHGAFLFGEGRRLVADALRVEVDDQHHERHDEQREQGDGPVEIPHRGESGDERDGALEDEEALAVKRLDALRIVGHAEAAVGAAALVVEFQRQRVQVGVELRAQAHEPVQADADVMIIVPIG